MCTSGTNLFYCTSSVLIQASRICFLSFTVKERDSPNNKLLIKIHINLILPTVPFIYIPSHYFLIRSLAISFIRDKSSFRVFF